MQTFKTIPQDENQKTFFARYGKYYSLITLGIILSQILSALTESGLIFTNVRDATSVFGATASTIAGITGALVGVALIEVVGIRVALTGAVDAFLYKRFKGLDLLFSVALIVLTIVLIPSSFVLSLKGGGQIVESLKDRTEQSKKAQLNDTKEFELASAKAEHDTKQLEIQNTYKNLIASTNERASAKKVVAQQNYDHWKSKGSRYKTKINNALVELQQVEADRTERIAELKEREALELNRLANTYEGDKEEIQIYHKGELVKTTSSIESKSSAFKTGTKFIVLIAMFFAVGFTIMHRVYLVGSGIEELAEPSNFFFAPSLSSERHKLALDKYQINKRNRIAEKRAQLPQLTPYASVLPVHDLAALERTILELKMQTGEQRKVHYLDGGVQLLGNGGEDLENRIQSLTQAQINAESENHHEAAKVLELQAKEVIKLYLSRNNQSTNEQEITSFHSSIISHLNEPKSVPNPFNTFKSQIGFKQQSSTPMAAVNNAPVSNASTGKRGFEPKQCENCGKTYDPYVRNQRFCSKDCRLDFHGKKHGKRFDPSFKKRKK